MNCQFYELISNYRGPSLFQFAAVQLENESEIMNHDARDESWGRVATKDGFLNMPKRNLAGWNP